MATFAHIGMVSSPTTFHPSHQHEVWELVLYTSGTGAITVGGEPVPFKPGTIVCLPPHVPHFERSPRGYTNYYLIFRDFSPPSEGIPVFADDADGSFKQLAAQLHREYHLKQANWRAICEALADLMVRYLERWAAPPAEPPLVERLERLLIERMHEPGFSVGEALRALGGSPDYARRLFQRARGKAPIDYLAELRVQHAKQLLATGARVREVAESVGVPDPYYFSRLFRRIAGESPSEYAATIAAPSAMRRATGRSPGGRRGKAGTRR